MLHLDKNPSLKSAEGALLRKNRICSSELSQMKIKKCNTSAKFIQFKNSIGEFKGNEHTLFGQMFEPIAMDYINRKMAGSPHDFIECGNKRFRYKYLYTTNSIEYQKESFKNLTYKLAATPDAIYAYRIPNNYNPGSLMVNIEIKCPSMRRVVDGDPIPQQYEDQVRSAAMCVNSDYSEFWDFQFRLCKGHHLNPWNKDFDRMYHKANYTVYPPKTHLECGYFIYGCDVSWITSRSDKIFTSLHNREIVPTAFEWGYPDTNDRRYLLCWKLMTVNKVKLRRNECKEKDIENMILTINNT